MEANTKMKQGMGRHTGKTLNQVKKYCAIQIPISNQNIA
jgi:hypothetical protein